MMYKQQEEQSEEQYAIEHQIPKIYKYKIEDSSKGARVTVHGDNLNDTILDYMEARSRLEANGFKVAPESGGFGTESNA